MLLGDITLISRELRWTRLSIYEIRLTGSGRYHLQPEPQISRVVDEVGDSYFSLAKEWPQSSLSGLQKGLVSQVPIESLPGRARTHQ